jgi:hypothetical protein
MGSDPKGTATRLETTWCIDRLVRPKLYSVGQFYCRLLGADVIRGRSVPKPGP